MKSAFARAAAVLVAALLVAPALTAQAPPPPPAVGIVVDLGYMSSTGNTNVTTFSLGEKITWSANPKLSFAQNLRLVYGEISDSVTANSVNGGVNGDYVLVAGVGITAGFTYERNRFAGIAQRLSQSLGVLWKFASANADSLRFDAGAVATQQRGVDDVEDSFVSARAGIWYKRPIGSGAYLQQVIEALPNLETSEDWRINSETALVAPLSRRVGLKVSYVIRHDNLPQPTFEKTDRVLTAGLQITR